jgi:hypothetical protein
MSERRRRVDLIKILDDPKQRKELMVRCLIATQSREGIEVSWEQAEEAYERIQQELRSRAVMRENPGVMVRNDEVSLNSAVKTFERFHDGEAGVGAYPFNKRKDGIFPLPTSVQWPQAVEVFGVAVRTLYESDKWHPKGNTTQYYHDHDRGLTFYVPAGEGDGEIVSFPHEWPEEVALLGACIGFVVKDSEGELAEGVMKGKNILVASPDGWIDPKKPNRVFLAIINLDGGGVEGIIDGGNLRITAHGIEG